MAYPYMGTTRHFHVVFDVRVLDLNLSINADFDVVSAMNKNKYKSAQTSFKVPIARIFL